MSTLSSAPRTDAAPFLSILTSLALGLGGLLTAIWLWSCWCAFPAIPWNDIRVAPAVALHHGVSIYTTASDGPVSTWIYGPLPLIAMWPAGLASNAIGAIQTAGAIHIGLTIVTLTLISLFWPTSTESGPRYWQRRLAVALLCVLLVRNQTSGYLVYSADAPGIAFGLFSLLALSHHRYWGAALCAVAAAACKQTLISVVVAQLIWLYISHSPQVAFRHLWRCVLTGSAVALCAVLYFGAAGLWHTMIAVPSRFPWASLGGRLGEHPYYLIVHVVLPVIFMLVWRRVIFRGDSPFLLPAIAFLCALPLSIAGFLKIGGNVNSLHSFWLWFPPSLAALVTSVSFGRLGQKGCLGTAMAVVLLASLWLQTSRLRVRPNIHAYHEAIRLADRLPQKIWFPSHPLVTLYSDGRFYHDLDGLCERSFASMSPSDDHFFKYMPAKRQVSATFLPVGWGLADMAEGRLPKDAPVHVFGSWRLDGHLD